MSTPNSSVSANLSDLAWMCGPWHGSLGPQRVEEAWSNPTGGTMSTMIRLTSETETNMIELIVIREQDDSLVLHLRQFSAELELRLDQNMLLHTITSNAVSFTALEGSAIPMLAYRNTSPETMEVDVTLADGMVVTAALQRGSC